MSRQPGGAQRAQVWTFEDGRIRARRDTVAVEEPLEIRLRAGGEQRRLGVTMRTPGNDFELTAGTLFDAGVVQSRHEIITMRYCVDAETDGEQLYNVINVDLRANRLPDLSAVERHFAPTSACGVCGRAGLESLRARGCTPVPSGEPVDAGMLCALPERINGAQGIFAATGGLHAAALFDRSGELLTLREDIGRHNAVDKLIGWAMLDGMLPLRDRILLVSGRAGYEIVQKAVVAGIPIVCAVSAPSSLAVQLARAFGITLVGFLRGARFNVYSAVERIKE